MSKTGEYATKGTDRKSRLLACQARVEKQITEASVNVQPETEEEATQWQLESNLAK